MGDAQLELLRRALLASGVTLPASGATALTVGRLWLLFKATLESGRRKDVRAQLRPFLVEHWRRPCVELTPALWERFRLAMLKTKTRYGRFFMQSTVNLCLTRVKQMLNFGIDERLLSDNPLRKAKRKKTRIGRETWLQPEQADALIAGSEACRWQHQKDTLRAFLCILLDSGLRFNEARKLRRDRIGLDGSVVIEAAITKTKSARIVVLTRRALRAIALAPQHATSPYLFAHPRKGGLWGEETIRGWFRTACKASGVDEAAADGDVRVVPHDCRHTFASLADARGARATQIAEVLGHASLRTTERYLHRSRTETAKAIAALMEGRRGPRRAAQKSERPRARDEKELVKRERGRVGFFS